MRELSEISTVCAYLRRGLKRYINQSTDRDMSTNVDCDDYIIWSLMDS